MTIRGSSGLKREATWNCSIAASISPSQTWIRALSKFDALNHQCWLLQALVLFPYQFKDIARRCYFSLGGGRRRSPPTRKGMLGFQLRYSGGFGGGPHKFKPGVLHERPFHTSSICCTWFGQVPADRKVVGAGETQRRSTCACPLRSKRGGRNSCRSSWSGISKPRRLSALPCMFRLKINTKRKRGREKENNAETAHPLYGRNPACDSCFEAQEGRHCQMKIAIWRLGETQNGRDRRGGPARQAL